MLTQKEIEGVTEATLQLAAASGTDLGNAASIVGSTLRAFNMDVDQTQRLVDVMAKSFSSSSLDIDKFSSAMANVAARTTRRLRHRHRRRRIRPRFPHHRSHGDRHSWK